ncbi:MULTISPECIES: ImmA/IrrE family metallo-endopeptidase [unclassified Mesorhizobium]|uniref:ImmA/IrrE family metallo-endopeptidase n=1 Tax=unclassified Mesorhizobium TaxID=325217 RepID=UPI00112E7284|nr:MULTISPECIES: ImmA/IrrE family metallo-endopeptidase [unclassified Mesorhizobium]TPJ46412.1 ImmA/IrrE family metallo-endopeptidase [Mesorhizobium sp. B2-6-6]MBZ9960338.1 ImmA/IrrE family metallo-endopeptidase [Mesorhizobium sp. BR1-1-14]MCA0003456.1 ImmA/IrrE family metallo-endopeptidase [Mesorhizobium sp. B264B2A]MCA0009801.1 ImmA/IrrE family metallo-endopeptidase [Mesorhizobium sp. B264B1B]MCA0020206.1 ImmA/IrrE family metallo-endopeptidase [Mesorhizobium sp. B264B1A]
MINYGNVNAIVQKYALVAPVNVKAIIGEIGLTYVERDMPPGESGYIEYDGWHCTIAVNINDGPQRKRFTAAHELGHFMMHRDLLKKHKHLDRLFDEAANRNPERPLDYKHEVQANQFASSLLMPKVTIERLLNEGVTTIHDLALRFDVSRLAMEYRLKTLGLIRLVTDATQSVPAE